MLQYLRDALHNVVGDVGDWDPLSSGLSTESIAPDVRVRAVGDTVTEALVVECGLFEVITPGAPPRWAVAGSIIGIAAALSRDASTVDVIARRHSRLVRIPADVMWARGGDAPNARDAMIAVARLARIPDHKLQALPPDPLIITALLESCDPRLEQTITTHLAAALHTMPGARLVTGAMRSAASAASAPKDELALQFAQHEDGASTVVYLVCGGDHTRGVDLVAHADRVLVFQPFGVDAPRSDALSVAYDGSARRHTELVYVHSERDSTSTATQQMQAQPRVRRIHQLPDPSPTQLESLLTDLRSGAREHDALRELAVFADLSAPELAWIQSTLHWTRVDGGSVLVQQGETCTGVWLLRAGRLQELRTSSLGEQQVATYGPGDIVGAKALLRGGRHTTSVRAVRDSTVALLDQQTFETLLEQSSGFARAVARVIASASGPGSDSNRANTMAVVPLADEQRVHAFVTELSVMCEEVGIKATVVDAARLNAALGPDASATRRGDVGDGEIIRWLDRLERQHDVVFLVCETLGDSWTRRAIRQSDHMLFVTDASAPRELRAIEHEIADAMQLDSEHALSMTGQYALGSVGALHLVLLQPGGRAEAIGTSDWLRERAGYTHHHVRAGEPSDLARLARRLSGRAVALALSGGSSRAPAHLGVVRAMDDLALPVDIVSGTSAGACIAALIASGFGGEHGLELILETITRGVPRLRQFQPPLTSLTSGAAADQMVQAIFGDRLLEDQFVPVIITAVDIRRHRPVYLRRGPIWKLVRASGSLPMLWPPVWHNDDLLVDGGLLNNLPTEVFNHEADNGLLIACNLLARAGTGAIAFDSALNYGTVSNSWRQLAHRMLRKRVAAPPGLVEILFHSMAIPSFQQQDGLSALGDRENICMLTPPIGSFGLFEVDARIGRRLEAVSWEYARQELRSVAARWHSRLEWRVTSATEVVQISAATRQRPTQQ